MSRFKESAPFLLIAAVLLSCGLGDKAKQVKEFAESVEQAQKRLEEGDSSGALGALLGGGEVVQPVNFRKLKELLPEKVAGLNRTNAGGETSRVMGVATAKAEGNYETEDRQGRIDIEITDLGSMRGIGRMSVNWLMAEVDRETENGYERTVRYEGYPAYEKFEQGSDWSRGQMSAFVADRFVVSASGNGVSESALKEALRAVSIRRLEAMKDEGVGEEAPPVPDASDFAASNPFVSGDPQDPGATGSDPSEPQQVEPVDFRELRALLPENVPGLPRASAEGEKTGTMGFAMSSATGTYQREGDRSKQVTVKITDSGTVQGMTMMGYAWLMMQVDKESDEGYERTTKYKGNPAYEKFSRRNGRSQGTLQTVIGNRFVVDIDGRGVGMDTVRAAIDAIPLEQLEKLRRSAAQPAS